MTADTNDYMQKDSLLDPDGREPRSKCFNPFSRNSSGEGGIDYIAIVGGFISQFFILGIMNNTGSLKNHWEKEYEISRTFSSLPGSLNYGFMFITGLFTPSLERQIGFANMHCIGCLICSIALLCTSVSPSFYYVIVSHGAIFGIGASFVFFSSIYVQLYYFKTKMAITSGLVSAGSGCGTMALTVLLDWSCSTIGWRNSLCLLSSVQLMNILFSLLYRTADFRGPCRGGILKRLFASTSSQMKVKSEKNRFVTCIRGIFDFSSLKNPCFVIFVISCFVFMLGYLVPCLHIKDLAVGAGIPSSCAAKFVGYMSIASLVGKITIGSFANILRVKTVALFQACFFFIGIIHIGSRFCVELWHFVTYSVLFGFFEGCYVALTSVVVVDILGQEKGPSGLGLLYGIKAIPVVIASPLAGLLHSKFDTFAIMFVASGATAILASAILTFIYCFSLSDIKIETKEYISEFAESKKEFDEESLEVTFNKSRQVL